MEVYGPPGEETRPHLGEGLRKGLADHSPHAASWRGRCSEGVAAAGALTAKFGVGSWSSLVNERHAQLMLRHARVRVGREGKKLVTIVRLASKKPWAIDVAHFTPVKRPLYLTGMAVAPTHQGQGLGRLAIEDAVRVAREWPADAVRLDAWDAEAGAGDFYLKCGFAERGRVKYKGSPLRYYEVVLA